MRQAAAFAGLLLCTALLLAGRLAFAPAVFTPAGVFLTDADCYARLQRALPVAEGRTLSLRHHPFENAPEGVRPHTTAPLDWLIALGALCLPGTLPSAVERSGACWPVLLGLVGGLAIWAWARRFDAPGRWAAPLAAAVSPSLAFGSSLGRSDHHALALTLVTLAVTQVWPNSQAPDEQGERHREGLRETLAGLCWGLALWTSLYEPLILWVLTLVGRWIARPGLWHQPAFRQGLATTGVVLLLALAVEGWRIHPIPAEWREYADAWAATVGELQPGWRAPGLLFASAGAAWVAAPLAVVGRNRRSHALPLLWLGGTFALSLWQIRWLPCFALASALSLPAVLARFRGPLWGTVAAIAILWPVGREWDRRLDHAQALDTQIARAEMVSLRAAAAQIEQGEIVLAPWWLSPPLAWWAGARSVAGSSHESIAGIVDSVRVALATDPEEALRILERRGVRYLLITDPDPVSENGSAILGRRPSDPNAILAVRLFRRPGTPPDFLKLRWTDGRVHLFEVTRAGR